MPSSWTIWPNSLLLQLTFVILLCISHDQKRQNSFTCMAISFLTDNLFFSHLGLQATWSRLKSMSLKGLSAEEEKRDQFLSSGTKDTLRSLVVKKCSLRSGFLG